MIEKTSSDFRIIFLQNFTREILRSTGSYIELKVKHEVKRPTPSEIESHKLEKQKKEIKSLVMEKMGQEKKAIDVLKSQPEETLFRSIMSRPFTKKPLRGEIIEKIIVPELKIPKPKTIEEPILPGTVRDIIPMPSASAEIELGKIDSLIRDPMVSTIEFLQPNSPMEVTGRMGRKKTSIALSQQEVNALIERFASAARIPFEPGFFRAAHGNLLISAIVSQESEQNSPGSKFIITKMHRRY